MSVSASGRFARELTICAAGAEAGALLTVAVVPAFKALGVCACIVAPESDATSKHAAISLGSLLTL